MSAYCALFAGKYACPAHAAVKCIRRGEGRQDGDAAFFQITLYTCFCGWSVTATAKNIQQIDIYNLKTS